MWQRGDGKRALEAGGKNDGCRRQGKGGQAWGGRRRTSVRGGVGGKGERASEVGEVKENEHRRRRKGGRASEVGG